MDVEPTGKRARLKKRWVDLYGQRHENMEETKMAVQVTGNDGEGPHCSDPR